MSKSKAAATTVREYADEEEEDILSVDSDANPSDAEEDEDEDDEEEVRAKPKKPAAKKAAADEDEDDEDESVGDNESEAASSDDDSVYGSDLEREPVNKSGLGDGSATEGKFAFDLDEFADEGKTMMTMTRIICKNSTNRPKPISFHNIIRNSRSIIMTRSMRSRVSCAMNAVSLSILFIEPCPLSQNTKRRVF